MKTRGLLCDGLADKTRNQQSVMDHGGIAILIVMEDSTLLLTPDNDAKATKIKSQEQEIDSVTSTGPSTQEMKSE